ncbi:LysR family transcriptional regulator [Williamsia maris]|uniref:DNA-binding transcriptional regulator, LysR family n=1 Tax=Williamsia maris TaxID=72806 RepID=A0ABT1HAY6_9NOCA|nr:LysR substrate-binding domain-containing protein [Williamsia maris]MCP2174905.1 DNA-binding transcriptional regulator, LysR family [Williamsia maris]
MELRLLSYFVAVADEGNVGRAAARLNMTQPPLSRAIRALETELGVVLLERTSIGVSLTAAGVALRDEARALLEQSERLRVRVAAAGGAAVITVGTLADTADQIGNRLVGTFRDRQPHVDVVVHETDLSDPTAGLRTGSVDVALTRTPFDRSGIRVHVLRSDPIGVVMRTDDHLARRDSVSLPELADRRWVRLPDGTDPLWSAYWSGIDTPDGPELRTISECVQSVLWNATSALAPIRQRLPPGLRVVPLTDREPSHLVVAWRATDPNPLVRAFVRVAADSDR